MICLHDHIHIVSIPYDQIKNVRVTEGSVVVVPAFTQYGFKRIHSWFREETIDPPLMQLLEGNSGLKLIFASYHPNSHWYPDHTDFRVYKAFKSE